VRLPDGTVGRWKRVKSPETGEREPTLLIDGHPAARLIGGKTLSTIVDPSGVEIASIHHISRKKSDQWLSLWEYIDRLKIHSPIADPLAGMVLAMIVRRYIHPRSILGEIFSSV